jgi:hypothetical protein
VKTRVLELLAERLPLVADGVRQEVTPSIKDIVNLIYKLITAPHAESITLAAFKVLRSICITLQPGEESAVTDAVPPVLNTIKQQTSAAPDALSALVPLSLAFVSNRNLSCLTSLQNKTGSTIYTLYA